jgi:hypothetical protein
VREQEKQKSFPKIHFGLRWFDWSTWIFVLAMLLAFPNSEMTKFKFGLVGLAIFLPLRLIALIIVDFKSFKK